MAINYVKLDYLENITSDDLPSCHKEWLLTLSAPTVIDFTIDKCDKWRVITTLLHGNEPSGFIATFNWIKNQEYRQLKTNLRIIICSIEAAQFEPIFTNRFLSGGRDINRCFGDDRLCDYFLRAELLSSCIRQVSPEAIIDLHNTSGKSPSFAVSAKSSNQHLALVSLFCHNVIISHITLGSLMEQDFNCPTVTIECGGAQDNSSHEIALNGIKRFTQIEDLSSIENVNEVEVIYHPIRVKLSPNTFLNYNDKPVGKGITLSKNIEEANFRLNKKGAKLGWVDDNGLNNLVIEDEHLHGKPQEFFEVNNNELVCANDFRIFMATNKAEIAMNDCLFYVVKEVKF